MDMALTLSQFDIDNENAHKNGQREQAGDLVLLREAIRQTKSSRLSQTSIQ